MRAKWLAAAAMALGVLVAAPSSALAQSAIAGLVRDTTGAVLPGVQVEASSDVLIEKTRSAVSDGEGRFQIIDLRPGTYVVTFTLQGFNTFRREGLELPSNFTMTVNADMRIGEFQETLVVTGDSPVVDIHSASSTQVVQREVYDSLPSARNVQSVAQLMPGVRMNVSDVGGSQAMQQQQFIVRGMSGGNNTVLFDGMNLNSMLGDGATVPYFNDATVQEFAFQAGALDADTTAGGGRLNVVPKDGGNTLRGSAFLAFNDDSWQADNFSQELKDQGLTSTGKIVNMYDVNGSIGGPVMKDKLWFLMAGRQYSVDNLIPGSAIIDDQYIKLASARLTWQINDKNKLSVHYDRMYKWRGHRYEPPQVFLEENASRIHDNPIYYWAVIKYTATLSNRLLVELGETNYVQPNTMRYQPGVARDPFTPEWYLNASRADRDLNTIWRSPAVATRSTPERYSWQGSVSYVTGSHHLKVGGNYATGRQRSFSESLGDLQQEYRSGVPDTVIIRNSPINFADALMNADSAVFVQDAWTFKQLTVTGGLRYRYFDASIPEQTSPAGRFVGIRRFDEIEHIPQFTDIVPRLSAVYDLFGNGKTAVKGNISKYLDQRTLSLTTPYNPLAATTARITWRDLNGDDVAQGELGCVYLTPGCEMQLSALPQNFGTRALNTADPDLLRPSNIEASLAIQHELRPRLSVAAGWYRRSFQKLLLTDYDNRSTADYTPFTVVSPLDGEVITAYNLAPAKLSLTQRTDTNASSDRTPGLQRPGIRGELAGARRLDRLWRTVVPEDRVGDVRPARRSEPASILRSVQQRDSMADRLQAERRVPNAVVGDHNQCGVPELSGPAGRDQLAPEQNNALRGELPRAMHTRCARVSDTDRGVPHDPADASGDAIPRSIEPCGPSHREAVRRAAPAHERAGRRLQRVQREPGRSRPQLQLRRRGLHAAANRPSSAVVQAEPSDGLLKLQDCRMEGLQEGSNETSFLQYCSPVLL